ncbi:MAG: FecR domain-containing protein, partial [Nitrospinota bacterium]
MKTLRNTLAALWMVAFVLVIWIVAFVFLASSLAHGQAPADPEGAANWKAVQAVGAPASPGGEAVKNKPITKFQFVQIFSRMPQAAQFVPENAQELSDEAFYGEVISRLVARGVKTLEGSKPDELLTRMQFVHITYLLAGGKPGPGYFEQKHFLKQRGIIQPNDIGIYKSLQGDVRVRPAGARDAIRIAEPVLFPVLFKDLDKTALGALLELEFDDLSVLTIGEETVLEINEMVYNPETQERSVVMKLTLGGLRVLASKVEGKSRFQVVTPTAVIGVRGTDFIIVVDGQGRTRVIVLDGLVGVGATAGG